MAKNPALTVNMSMLVSALSLIQEDRGRSPLWIGFSDGRIQLKSGGAPFSFPAKGTWPRTAKIRWKSMPKIGKSSRPIFPKAEITLIGLEEEIDFGGLQVPCSWDEPKKRTE